VRTKNLVLSAVYIREEHTKLRRADIWSSSTSFKIDWKEENTAKVQTNEYLQDTMMTVGKEHKGIHDTVLTTVISSAPVTNKNRITPL
jgi:hypothetical protein